MVIIQHPQYRLQPVNADTDRVYFEVHLQTVLINRTTARTKFERTAEVYSTWKIEE